MMARRCRPWSHGWRRSSWTERSLTRCTALDAVPGAAEAFGALAPSVRKQFIYQVDSAKRPDTRQRRAEDIARSTVT